MWSVFGKAQSFVSSQANQKHLQQQQQQQQQQPSSNNQANKCVEISMGKKSKRNTTKARNKTVQPHGLPPPGTTNAMIDRTNPPPSSSQPKKTAWTNLFQTLLIKEGVRGAADCLLNIVVGTDDPDDEFLQRWKAATEGSLGRTTNSRMDPTKCPYFESSRLRAFIMYFNILQEEVTVKGAACDKTFVKETDRAFLKDLPKANNYDPYFVGLGLFLEAGIMFYIHGNPLESMLPLYRAEAILSREIANTDEDTLLPEELVQGLTDVHSSAKFAIEKMTTMNGHIFQHLESHLRHLQNTDRTWMKPRTAKEVRETMDAFMAIVDYLEKDNWTGERINTFFMYAVQTNTNIQGRANEMTFFPQFHFDNHKFGKYLFDVRDDDRKFLKKMLRSKKTPLFIRAHSLQVLGVVAKILDGARAEAMVYFRGCVALCDAVSVEERRQALPLSSPDDPSMTIIQVPLKDGNTTTIQTIGDYLLFVREQAEFFLKVAAVLGKFCGGASSLIPGDYCDGCGTTRGKDESSFLVCSRCKITYYCGKECQASDWKLKHKKECRKKGEFKVGDKVFCKDPSGLHPFGLNLTGLETPCVIVAQGEEANTWQVEAAHGENRQVFPASKLRLMEPSEIRLGLLKQP